MRIQIHGDYKTEDVTVLGQHIAVQLEELGVLGVGNIWLSVRPLDAKGRKLDVLADGKPVDTIELQIDDLERPAVQAAKLTVRESVDAAPSSPPRRAPRRRYERKSN